MNSFLNNFFFRDGCFNQLQDKDILVRLPKFLKLRKSKNNRNDMYLLLRIARGTTDEQH